MLNYLVYLTYCKICDRLLGYEDTDLASLIEVCTSNFDNQTPDDSKTTTIIFLALPV